MGSYPDTDIDPKLVSAANSVFTINSVDERTVWMYYFQLVIFLFFADDYEF